MLVDANLLLYAVDRSSPHHERAAGWLTEQLNGPRRIGLPCWTPGGFLGDLFRVVASYVPPVPGVQSPLLWGTDAHVQNLFEDASTIRHTVQQFAFRYRSAKHFVDVFRSYYGPVHKAFAALDTGRQSALEADLVALLQRSSRGGTNGLVVDGEYLETVITK